LLHISRYIHRNPQDYKEWPYSSYGYYVGGKQAEWVRPQKIYDLYEWGTYEAFVADDNELEESLNELLTDRADS
jgi:hypothetical protein